MMAHSGQFFIRDSKIPYDWLSLEKLHRLGLHEWPRSSTLIWYLKYICARRTARFRFFRMLALTTSSHFHAHFSARKAITEFSVLLKEYGHGLASLHIENTLDMVDSARR